jgi:hypothetical protein
MQEKLDGFDCTQLDMSTWMEACWLFHHDPERRDSEFVVKVPGFERRLLPVQAHSVCRTLLMQQPHEIGHCFHGHAMGIGKTTIAFAVHRVQHLVNLMRADVDDLPDRHLSVDDNDGSTQCPSNDDIYKTFGLDCPCSSKNITSRICGRYGVTVMISPLGLLRNWAQEYRKCYGISQAGKPSFDPDDRFCTLFLVAHSSARGPYGEQLTKDAIAVASCEARFRPGSEEGELPQLPPRLHNSRCFIVTTARSFQSRVVDSFRQTIRWDYYGPKYLRKKGKDTVWSTPKPKPMSRSYTRLILSSIWRDEAHEDKKSTSPTMNILRSSFVRSRQNRHLMIHLMTGTLISTGASDIAFYLECMAYFSHRLWARHPILRDWSNDEAVQHGKAWDKLMREARVRDADVNNTIATLRPLVQAVVMRFHSKSSFLDRGEVIKLLPNWYKEISCDYSQAWTSRLKDLKAQEDARYDQRESKRRADYIKKGGNVHSYVPLKREGITLHYRARLFASFPALMDVDDHGEKMSFTQDEWVQNHRSGRWDSTNGSDPYSKHIEAISESSGKLRAIRTVIEAWDGKKDGEGLPPRMIFCSYFFAASRIMFLVS